MAQPQTDADRRLARLNRPLSEQHRMWYFTWILGVLLAVAFGIINVMWYESSQCMGDPRDDQPDV